MQHISGYEGKLLNHLQGFYPQGDHALAVELLEALGLTCVDIPVSAGSTLLRVHLNSEDRNNVDNVIFLAEQRPALARFDALLQDRLKTDTELSDALAGYLESARNGDNTPHFGVHYRTAADLEQAMERVQHHLSAALSERVTLTEMPAYGPVADFPDIRQVFVRTDVFAFGTSVIGQTIELLVERGE